MSDQEERPIEVAASIEVSAQDRTGPRGRETGTGSSSEPALAAAEYPSPAPRNPERSGEDSLPQYRREPHMRLIAHVELPPMPEGAVDQQPIFGRWQSTAACSPAEAAALAALYKSA